MVWNNSLNKGIVVRNNCALFPIVYSSFCRKSRRGRDRMRLFIILWTVVFFVGMMFCIPGYQVAALDYSPAYAYLIDCGATENSTVDGRSWESDAVTSYVTSSQEIFANVSLANTDLGNVDMSNLLLTARVFKNASKYSFPVTPGRYWIRLYFFPFNFDTLDLTSAVFSVGADDYTLLSNVNITRELQSSNSRYLFKEYSINATSNSISIYFTPVTCCAFINALEVVSLPSAIFPDDSSPLGINRPVLLGMPSIALESMYRINVGGPFLNPANDSLWRTWNANESFLLSSVAVQSIAIAPSLINYRSIPTYFAPSYVYSTALQIAYPGTAQPSVNMSWKFSIDSGFLYMVRLHFCELNYTSQGQREMNIYIQKQLAYQGLDILQMAVYPDSPYFRDFTVDASSNDDTSLSLDIGPTPNAGMQVISAILNGIEIWKLNNSFGSLDGIGAPPILSNSHSKIKPVVGAVAGGAAALGFLFVGIYLFSRHKFKGKKKTSAAWPKVALHEGNSASIISTVFPESGTGSYVSSAPSSLGRHFTFAEILEATDNFDEVLAIGVGGFGKVYKGQLEDGTKVAVKRGNRRSEQGLTEFQTEIEILSKLRHRHLVSLIGSCHENGEMILVYEFMANGPLRSHLYGSDLAPLSWKQRLEICIGAARGLHYLHTGVAEGIIHRDVKTTNILLDENLVAKVSDFGLSKTGPTLDQTHVTTAVKGSFGYLDPEYFRRQQLTEKSDVYSFGVVLLEILCARPAINPALPRDQVNIAEWAMHWQKMGMLVQIIDTHLAGTINVESLKKFGETAEKCLAEQGIDRPTMGDVLWNLEYIMQLQETALSHDSDEDSTNQLLELPIQNSVQDQWDASIVDSHILAREDNPGDESASAVFFQMIHSQAR